MSTILHDSESAIERDGLTLIRNPGAELRIVVLRHVAVT
jgi:hypothetical protein